MQNIRKTNTNRGNTFFTVQLSRNISVVDQRIFFNPNLPERILLRHTTCRMEDSKMLRGFRFKFNYLENGKFSEEYISFGII